MDIETIYRLYFRDVFLFLQGLTGSETLAEELTQETFFKALDGLKGFDGRQDVRAWLFTVARNAYYDHCRKAKRTAPLEAAAEDAGVDPTRFYTTRTLAQAFLAACDKDRMESFAPLFTGSSTAGQAALAALLPNTFLQALVWRTLTASALPEVTEDEGL